MKGPTRREQETAKLAGEVARRAARRLDIFEWVMFGAAFVVALVGGAGVAWLLAEPGTPAFRYTWAGAALTLFVVPGAIVLVQTRRAAGAATQVEKDREGDHG